MRPFVLNGHGRLVFPSNFSAELDFSVLETLEQLEAVVRRDFEAKAPTGTEILERVDAGAVGGYTVIRVDPAIVVPERTEQAELLTASPGDGAGSLEDVRAAFGG